MSISQHHVVALPAEVRESVERIDPSWRAVLEPFLGEHLVNTWRNVVAKTGDDVLPGDVFRAFRQPSDAVRVLIVGQDPYPTPGHAMGLSFSTAPGVPAPRSLKNIYRELAEDVGVLPPPDGDISVWEKQGIMLLNRVLTVAPGQAGCHRGLGWEALTDAAITLLNRAPMVAILWGKDAQKCAPLLDQVPILESAHPSPLSARRGFFGSRPFSRANELLWGQGADPVQWGL